MSFALGDFIMKKFPQARYVDASELVDRIKVIKSAGGAGAGQARRADAGRRHAGGVRRGQARHARPRSRGDRAVLQPAQRLGERHLSLRLDAARHSRPSSASATCRTASSRRATPIALLVEDQRPGRHVHRARPHLRGRRQGAAGDEGRARSSCKKSRKLTLDLLKPGTPCKDIWETVQRLHAQERPARGGAALLPRPGLRPGRAAADPQRRAVDHREGHEHRRPPDLQPRRLSRTGCATTTSSAATAPATACTSSRKRWWRRGRARSIRRHSGRRASARSRHPQARHRESCDSPCIGSRLAPGDDAGSVRKPCT